MTSQALVLVRGDSRTLTATLKRPAGQPTWSALDCTALAFSAAHSAGADPVWALDLTDGVTVTAALTAEVAITPAMWLLYPGSRPLVWDLEGTDPDGTVTTVAMGTISVVQDVTRP